MLFSKWILGLGISASLFASEGRFVRAKAAHFTSSPSYYTSSIGEVELTFEDIRAPWGTQVSVIYGWEGESRPGQYFQWKNRAEKSLEAIAPYRWKVAIAEVTHNRSSQERITHLNFVIRVQYPHQAAFYVKGNPNSPQGYLKLRLPPAWTYKQFHPRELEVVEKH